MRLEVGPETLIPRPETELLVELALKLQLRVTAARVLELGTGSGAIAAALASERRNWRITASDASLAALALAERNFRRLGLNNVRPLHGDWYAALAPGERFDLILSNPPYVAQEDPHLQQGDLPWEPRDALAAGVDGLDAIRIISAEALAHLVPGGWLLLEHGCDQGPAVRGLLGRAGLCQVASERDLAGLERVSLGRAPRP